MGEKCVRPNVARIREEMEKTEQTLSAFAIKVGVSKAVLSKVLNGDQKTVSLHTITKMATRLSIPRRELVGPPAERQVTVVTTKAEIDHRLLDQTFDLYTSVFKHDLMRADVEECRHWLECSAAAQRFPHLRDPWREMWAILHDGQHVGGFASVSIHTKRRLCNGNYFWVDSLWQSHQQGDWELLDAVRSHVLHLVPAMQDMVIEVAPIDFECLKVAEEKETILRLDQPVQRRVVRSWENFCRVKYFQRFGAHVILGADGLPLPYRGAPLRKPLCEENEPPLILMVIPLCGEKPHTSIDKVLNFLYDDLYLESHSEPGETFIAGYKEWVQRKLKPRIRRKARGASFGKLSLDSLPKQMQSVRAIVKSEKIELSMRADDPMHCA